MRVEIYDVVVSLAALLFAGLNVTLWGRYKKLKVLARAIVDAWEDDKLTQEELERIVKSFMDLIRK